MAKFVVTSEPTDIALIGRCLDTGHIVRADGRVFRFTGRVPPAGLVGPGEEWIYAAWSGRDWEWCRVREEHGVRHFRVPYREAVALARNKKGL